jgi:hypothetical protein
MARQVPSSARNVTNYLFATLTAYGLQYAFEFRVSFTDPILLYRYPISDLDSRLVSYIKATNPTLT